MPLLKKWNDDGGVWAIWHVTESMEVLLACLSDTLVHEECERLKAPSRKMEFLAVRVLLKAVTGREMRVGHLPSGRPFLEGEPWRVSISHTKNYVAVGLHETAVPGIDVEQYAERVRKVESRFIRNDEMPERVNMKREEELYQLLLHWSAKETLFKVMGCKEVDFLRHLKVFPFKLASSGGIRGESYHPDQKSSYQIHYLIHPEFVCTYCVGKASNKQERDLFIKEKK